MQTEKKKILFFIKGVVPTEAEFKAAAAVGTLTFRSLESFHDRDNIEHCDGVAGLAPAVYAAKFPVVDKPKEVPPPPPPPVAPEAPPSAPPPPPPPPPPGPPNPFGPKSS